MPSDETLPAPASPNGTATATDLYDLLTVDDVAALLKVSRSWVYEHTRLPKEGVARQPKLVQEGKARLSLKLRRATFACLHVRRLVRPAPRERATSWFVD